MFRALNKKEIAEFREYARLTHSPGATIQNDVHHPIIVLESMIMDEEVKVESNLKF